MGADINLNGRSPCSCNDGPEGEAIIKCEAASDFGKV